MSQLNEQMKAHPAPNPSGPKGYTIKAERRQIILVQVSQPEKDKLLKSLVEGIQPELDAQTLRGKEHVFSLPRNNSLSEQNILIGRKVQYSKVPNPFPSFHPMKSRGMSNPKGSQQRLVSVRIPIKPMSERALHHDQSPQTDKRENVRIVAPRSGIRIRAIEKQPSARNLGLDQVTPNYNFGVPRASTPHAREEQVYENKQNTLGSQQPNGTRVNQHINYLVSQRARSAIPQKEIKANIDSLATKDRIAARIKEHKEMKVRKKEGLINIMTLQSKLMEEERFSSRKGRPLSGREGCNFWRITEPAAKSTKKKKPKRGRDPAFIILDQ